jgi:hypothetical protein
MGTEAPRWWRQLLDQLQAAAAEATAAAAAADGNAAAEGWQPSNIHAICDTIGNLCDLPDKMPKAVWKRLLALQVLAVAVNQAQGCSATFGLRTSTVNCSNM